MVLRETRAFDCDLATPGAARAWSRVHLATALAGGEHRPSLIDDAILVVSELVTNAVRAGSDLVLSLRTDDRSVVVTVSDDVPELPRPRNPGPDAQSGRGLVIVAALADSWGITARGPGKSVWAEILFEPDSAEAPHQRRTGAEGADAGR